MAKANSAVATGPSTQPSCEMAEASDSAPDPITAVMMYALALSVAGLFSAGLLGSLVSSQDKETRLVSVITINVSKLMIAYHACSHNTSALLPSAERMHEIKIK